VKVDMSPRAITERLQLVSELTVLCLFLGKARPAGEASPSSNADQADPMITGWQQPVRS
jgi:hypothetical protein